MLGHDNYLRRLFWFVSYSNMLHCFRNSYISKKWYTLTLKEGTVVPKPVCIYIKIILFFCTNLLILQYNDSQSFLKLQSIFCVYIIWLYLTEVYISLICIAYKFRNRFAFSYWCIHILLSINFFKRHQNQCSYLPWLLVVS